MQFVLWRDPDAGPEVNELLSFLKKQLEERGRHIMAERRGREGVKEHG